MKGLFQTLKSYMQGKLTSNQEREFRDWLGSEEGRHTFSKWVESSYHEIDEKETHPDWQADSLLKRILEKKRGEVPPTRNAQKINLGAWTYQIVASLLFLFFFGSVWYNTYLKTEGQDLESEFVPVLITKKNPKGQKSRILLPDSSIVYLNADSELSYWQNFIEGREVTLIGEAFFEVKSDSLNPFVVKSPRLSSTALGTSFNVSAYPNQLVETVSLATGKIRVATSYASESVLLRPGEATSLEDKTEKLTKFPIDAELPALWTKGILHFEKVPWSQVKVQLERWYGVTIHVSGALSDPICSGSFEQNEYLNNVLEVLGHSIGFSYSINGKIVKIHIKP